MKKIDKHITSTLALTLCLSACSTTVNDTYKVKASRLAAGQTEYVEQNLAPETDDTVKRKPSQRLDPIALSRSSAPSVKDPSLRFSDAEEVIFAADELPLKDFVHNLFNDLLNQSYVVASDVAAMQQPVTLNIKEPVSKRQAYKLAVELLMKNGVAIAEKAGVFYLAVSNEQDDSAIGVGSNISDVPNIAGTVTQVVPLRFSNPSIESAITQFVRVRASRDAQMNALFISGTYPDVLRAMELVRMMDIPSNRGRYVRLIRLTYLSPDDFSKKLGVLLESEGVDAVGVGSSMGKNTVIVPIENIGAVAVFSSNANFVERAQFWAEQIDVAGEGVQKRYFIYHPSYARAADLGESVASLLGQSTSSANTARDTRSAFPQNNSSSDSTGQQNAQNAEQRSTPVNVQNDRLSMSVDERSNTLIFYTQGSEYQALLPMIKRLDVMPKQILLEATIAEVTLTDDFAMGVEFAFRNGKINYGTSGAFGVSAISGLNFGYVNGADSVLARLQQNNQLVNVLSNPYLVVRDGVTANISVGSDIPSVSSVTQDPLLSDKQTTNITYKQTGLEFSVLPTINGQGLVVMQIVQSNSNVAEGSVVSGAQAIFKRALKTEVIAHSGQTILLGGLISENDDNGDSRVPFLADIPLLGNLFKSRTQKKTKTELVLLITPKVIDSTEHWHYINDQLRTGFKHLQIGEQ